MKSKLEMLAEKIECKDRKETRDGFPYCTSFEMDCPYIDKTKYVHLGMMQCHPCTYHQTFNEVEKK